MIGRQKGNFDVLREFLHLNETTLNRVKSMGMTEKGHKSEFLVVIGEKAETTHSFCFVPTPVEYWLMTTYPRERWYRQWWLATHPDLGLIDSYTKLAEKHPHGLSAVSELPEERSGEVSRVGVGRSKRGEPQNTAVRPGAPAEETEAVFEGTVVRPRKGNNLHSVLAC
jgi:hypothetical protein